MPWIAASKIGNNRSASSGVVGNTLHIYASLAEQERRLISERIMDIRLSARAPNSISRRTGVRLWVLVAVSSLGTSIASVAAEPLPLAINGYDPVAYFTDGKPIRGLPKIAFEWNGYRYRFSSAGHRDLFKADPKRYAPQFENYCAMALSKGELVVADPENWLISDGKLYVFGRPAPAGPTLFQTDLVGNIARANQNRSLIPKR